MEEEQDEGGSPAQALELTYLKAAFLAMEPADFVVSLARCVFLAYAKATTWSLDRVSAQAGQNSA